MRFANYIIDYLVVSALFFLFGLVAAALTYVDIYFLYDLTVKMADINRLEDYLMTNSVYLIYLFCMEYFTSGRSIGKYITGTKVVMIDGSELTQKQIFIRSISRLVPFDGLSFLGENGWHDSWSDTRVVSVKNYENAKSVHDEIQDIGKKDME